MTSTIGARCACVVALGLTLAGCSTHADPAAEAPPPAHVEHEQDLNVVLLANMQEGAWEPLSTIHCLLKAG